MATYIIVSRFSTEAFRETHEFKTLAEAVSAKIKKECSGVKWKDSFATLGRFDVVDIVEANDPKQRCNAVEGVSEDALARRKHDTNNSFASAGGTTRLASRCASDNALMKMVTDDIIVIHPNGRLCEGLTNSAPTLSEFLDSSNWSSLRLLKKP
jgi:uncharacterized protein with GYD domain